MSHRSPMRIFLPSLLLDDGVHHRVRVLQPGEVGDGGDPSVQPAVVSAPARLAVGRRLRGQVVEPAVQAVTGSPVRKVVLGLHRATAIGRSQVSTFTAVRPAKQVLEQTRLERGRRMGIRCARGDLAGLEVHDRTALDGEEVGHSRRSSEDPSAGRRRRSACLSRPGGDVARRPRASRVAGAPWRRGALDRSSRASESSPPEETEDPERRWLGSGRNDGS